MEDDKSRTTSLQSNSEEEGQLWRQLLLKEAWRRRMLSWQLMQLKLKLLPLPPPPPPPRRESVELDYSGLTAFLEVDRSFFSPWNWSPDSPQNQDNARTNGRMIFQSDSFFSVDQEKQQGEIGSTNFEESHSQIPNITKQQLIN